MPKILIVDDSDFELALMHALVHKRLGYECIETTDGNEAVRILTNDADNQIAAVLLDLSMPHIDGRKVLAQMRGIRPSLPVIVVTGTQNIADVIEVIKLGATDYIVKPPNGEIVRNALARAVQLYDLRHEIEMLRGKDGAQPSFDRLVSNEPAMRTCVKLGRRAASSDITVLITGESGVGKEMMARSIHSESARKDKPFIAVNCGAIPKDLVESTLFGHKKGAFTGATSDAPGKFREAEGGTLFLDEIGELPLEAQVKLLRALQQREIEPVGGGATVPVNIRVVAATNRNPMQAMRSGVLREDLFYRLNVFPIQIPSLRERPGDIIPLAEQFVLRYAALENNGVTGFDQRSEEWMTRHSWPGNVRELENMIFRAVLLCDTGRIGIEHVLGISAQAESQPAASAPTASASHASAVLNLVDASGSFKTMKQIQAEAEHAALNFYGNDIGMAAENLGIGRSTFYRHRQR